MPKYQAIINVPGYLPMDDDPPVFDTAQEAWQYLAEQRRADEDGADTPGADYTETVGTLLVIATTIDKVPYLDLDPDGTGTVYGATPGYEGDHDLGVAYSVVIVHG